jgi:hypothetical protein
MADGGYPAAFVASASAGRSVQGLAAFSASNGRLLRWLVRSTSLPVPVAVSPDGAWVYYYYPAAPPPRCPGAGFVEPVLWRVRVTGGQPQSTGLRTTALAFSPDGRMVAHTAARSCGQTLLIVVRDHGLTRQIIAAHNVLTGNGVISDAELSWAPDDAHLAVAMAPAAAINTVEVINARRATDMTRAQSIQPCRGSQVGCLDPGFDIHGRLTFLKWTQQLSAEWVVRWRNGPAVRLFQVSRPAAFGAAIAVDRTGNAILLTEYLRQPEIWRWSGGSLALVLRSTPGLVVTNPLWLSR